MVGGGRGGIIILVRSEVTLPAGVVGCFRGERNAANDMIDGSSRHVTAP
jgi:hypothetical protein